MDERQPGRDILVWHDNRSYLDRRLLFDAGQRRKFEKYERGYDVCVNIWGSDHHGYMPRIRAVLQAAGIAEIVVARKPGMETIVVSSSR